MKKTVGEVIPKREIVSIASGVIDLPASDALTHLQFRRYAGCPICNLHLMSFVKRHDELKQLGVREVAVFHSPKDEMLKEQFEAPFAFIADPERKLYRDFGVEPSVWSILNPGAWASGVQGLLKHGVQISTNTEAVLGLPADFLIKPDGTIAALKYGTHADDQWSFEEVLQLARKYQP
ncbi:MAG: peroxiredoxin-like family protein [Puniceicoccales bacterium]